jgi:beta-glucosidase
VISPLDGLRSALADMPGGDAVEVTHAVGVVLREGVSPVRLGQVRDPETGEPGVRVRYLDENGTVLAEEVRLSGRVGWSDPRLEHGAVAVEMLAAFTADAAGTWRVGGGGLGALTVSADGTVLVDADLRPAEGEEAEFAHFITPPQRSAPLELAQGQEVQLRLHAVPQPVVGLTVAELSVARPARSATEEIEQAADLARDADVAVVVVGTTDLDESEGFDRTTLALPGRQDDLVRAVAAANPRTVVVVNSGSPVLMPWREEVAAVLLAWFGGQELGSALADVLLGRVEPGGRLPTTWPAREEDVPVLSTTARDGVVDYAEGLHIGHRAWIRSLAAGGPQPAYWFGHGLGWTTWELADLRVPAGIRLPAFDGSVTDEAAFVRVRLTNTGGRRGRQVVQAYLSRDHSAIDRPALWLAGFAAVEVDPGESVDVDVPLARRAFEHWAGGWAVEPGPYLLTVGFSAGDRPLEAGLDVRLS